MSPITRRSLPGLSPGKRKTRARSRERSLSPNADPDSLVEERLDLLLSGVGAVFESPDGLAKGDLQDLADNLKDTASIAHGPDFAARALDMERPVAALEQWPAHVKKHYETLHSQKQRTHAQKHGKGGLVRLASIKVVSQKPASQIGLLRSLSDELQVRDGPVMPM